MLSSNRQLDTKKMTFCCQKCLAAGVIIHQLALRRKMMERIPHAKPCFFDISLNIQDTPIRNCQNPTVHFSLINQWTAEERWPFCHTELWNTVKCNYSEIKRNVQILWVAFGEIQSFKMRDGYIQGQSFIVSHPIESKQIQWLSVSLLADNACMVFRYSTFDKSAS